MKFTGPRYPIVHFPTDRTEIYDYKTTFPYFQDNSAFETDIDKKRWAEYSEHVLYHAYAVQWYGYPAVGDEWQLGEVLRGWVNSSAFKGELTPMARAALANYPYDMVFWPSMAPWNPCTWPDSLHFAINKCLHGLFPKTSAGLLAAIADYQLGQWREPRMEMAIRIAMQPLVYDGDRKLRDNFAKLEVERVQSEIGFTPAGILCPDNFKVRNVSDWTLAAGYMGRRLHMQPWLAQWFTFDPFKWEWNDESPVLARYAVEWDMAAGKLVGDWETIVYHPSDMWSSGAKKKAKKSTSTRKTKKAAEVDARLALYEKAAQPQQAPQEVAPAVVTPVEPVQTVMPPAETRMNTALSFDLTGFGVETVETEYGDDAPKGIDLPQESAPLVVPEPEEPPVPVAPARRRRNIESALDTETPPAPAAQTSTRTRPPAATNPPFVPAVAAAKQPKVETPTTEPQPTSPRKYGQLEALPAGVPDTGIAGSNNPRPTTNRNESLNLDLDNPSVAAKGDYVRQVPHPWLERPASLTAYRHLLWSLRQAGITSNVSLTGEWCGLELYVKEKFRGTQWPGMDFPINAGFLRKLQPSIDADVELVNRAVYLDGMTMLYRELPPDSEADLRKLCIDSNVLDAFKAFAEDLVAFPGEKDRRLSKMVGSRVTEQSQPMPVSLIGQSWCAKTVFPTEWFPAQVRELTLDTLLKLFPPAERESIALSLGRALVGADGEKLTEVNDVLRHTYRALPLIVGYDPGLGKSTLLQKYLLNTMSALGFECASMHQKFGEFAFTGVRKDLLFIDDMTRESQKKMLKDADVKSLVSNGLMAVNAKYESIRSVNSRAVLVICCNEFDPSVFIDVDPGIVSRMQVLATETRPVMLEGDDWRPHKYWRKLAKQCGVNVQVLAAWVLRLCANKFLTCIGYNPETLLQERESQLEETYIGLRARYSIATDLHHVKELVKGVANMVALAAVQLKLDAKQLQALSRLRFGHQLLTPYLTAAVCETNATVPDSQLNSLAAVHCPSIDWFSLRQNILGQLEAFAKLDTTKSYSGALEYLLGHLTARNGFSFPRSEASYTPLWEQTMRTLPELVERARDWELAPSLVTAVENSRVYLMKHVQHAMSAERLTKLQSAL